MYMHMYMCMYMCMYVNERPSPNVYDS